uniref:regulator of nonsense transcripts UPF3 isoform X2 n=1 Tax=Fragaria vesca subsp. vesca TaxID=101020 RepID=UPI0005C85CE1|nr:PREDICTED: regulator of nonsense transcripts UPF3 isoform X2 [Fragaria vesca subsp. vesca]
MKDPLVRTKVLVRHLPPSLSQSDFFQQIDHLFGDRHNWFCFRPGKNSHKHQRYSRAYIEFKRPEDVFEFAEFFDGHVFVNEKGTQFKSIVEYAPSQRVPKPSNKKDGREGTIYKDPDYLEFLKLIAKPAEHLPSAEIQLERKEAEQAGAAKEAPIVTPLMEYIRQKRAVGSGTQISSVVRKVRRRTGAASFSKRGSTSTKRVSEKKKYILKDTAKYTSRKDRSTFNVLPRREDQLASSSGKDTMGNEIDSGRTKILLKRETPPAPEGISQHQASIGSSPVSASPKQNQRRDASGRFLRSILSHNEVRQREASAEVQSQQKILGPNSDIKRVPRPSNARLGLNNETNSMSSEGDRRRVMVDKFTKKDMHGTTNISEKQDRHTRNKDRPDRGVWTPLRRAESSHNSDEHLSSSASQRPQLLSDSVEVPHGEVKADTSYGSRTGEVPTGSNRHFGRRGTASSMKDDGSLNTSEGKSSKRGAAAAVHGAPEKQVWVQKSSGS